MTGIHECQNEINKRAWQTWISEEELKRSQRRMCCDDDDSSR